MALIYINDVCSDVRIGLWRMDEEADELFDRYPHLRQLEMPFKNTGRQKEFLCVRALLMEMTGDDALHIDHLESGRPVICRGLQISDNMQIPYNKWQVSISHTRGYAVLMLSRTKVVGVDIEYCSDRITKIASHFIRPDEMVETVEQMLILWCAKETLYKLHSEDNLHYFDMRQVSVAQSDLMGENMCDDREVTLENMKRGELVTIHVTLTPEYVLTWAWDLSTGI